MANVPMSNKHRSLAKKIFSFWLIFGLLFSASPLRVWAQEQEGTIPESEINDAENIFQTYEESSQSSETAAEIATGQTECPQDDPNCVKVEGGEKSEDSSEFTQSDVTGFQDSVEELIFWASIDPSHPKILLNEADIDAIAKGEVDERVLKTLVYLVKPAELGGAGFERLEIKRLVKNYTTEKKQTSQETTYPEGEEPNISSHYTGQAVDISAIDTIPMMRVIKKKTLGFSSRKFIPLRPLPIQVGWQTDQGRQLGGPSLVGDSYNQLFRNLLLNNFKDSLEENLDYEIPELQGFTLKDWLTSIGIAAITGSLGLPFEGIVLNENGQPDILASFMETGKSVLAEKTHLPREAFEGANLEEVARNAARSYLEQKLELEPYSLKGDSYEEILINIGKRKLEKELGIKNGCLDSRAPEDVKNCIETSPVWKGKGNVALDILLNLPVTIQTDNNGQVSSNQNFNFVFRSLGRRVLSDALPQLPETESKEEPDATFTQEATADIIDDLIQNGVLDTSQPTETSSSQTTPKQPIQEPLFQVARDILIGLPDNNNVKEGLKKGNILDNLSEKKGWQNFLLRFGIELLKNTQPKSDPLTGVDEKDWGWIRQEIGKVEKGEKADNFNMDAYVLGVGAKKMESEMDLPDNSLIDENAYRSEIKKPNVNISTQRDELGIPAAVNDFFEKVGKQTEAEGRKTNQNQNISELGQQIIQQKIVNWMNKTLTPYQPVNADDVASFFTGQANPQNLILTIAANQAQKALGLSATKVKELMTNPSSSNISNLLLDLMVRKIGKNLGVEIGNIDNLGLDTTSQNQTSQQKPVPLTQNEKTLLQTLGRALVRDALKGVYVNQNGSVIELASSDDNTLAQHLRDEEVINQLKWLAGVYGMSLRENFVNKIQTTNGLLQFYQELAIYALVNGTVTSPDRFAYMLGMDTSSVLDLTQGLCGKTLFDKNSISDPSKTPWLKASGSSFTLNTNYTINNQQICQGVSKVSTPPPLTQSLYSLAGQYLDNMFGIDSDIRKGLFGDNDAGANTSFFAKLLNPNTPDKGQLLLHGGALLFFTKVVGIDNMQTAAEVWDFISKGQSDTIQEFTRAVYLNPNKTLEDSMGQLPSYLSSVIYQMNLSDPNSYIGEADAFAFLSGDIKHGLQYLALAETLNKANESLGYTNGSLDDKLALCKKFNREQKAFNPFASGCEVATLNNLDNIRKVVTLSYGKARQMWFGSFVETDAPGVLQQVAPSDQDRKDLSYRIADAFLIGENPNIPFGFSKAMFEGDGKMKTIAAALVGINSLAAEIKGALSTKVSGQTAQDIANDVTEGLIAWLSPKKEGTDQDTEQKNLMAVGLAAATVLAIKTTDSSIYTNLQTSLSNLLNKDLPTGMKEDARNDLYATLITAQCENPTKDSSFCSKLREQIKKSDLNSENKDTALLATGLAYVLKTTKSLPFQNINFTQIRTNLGDALRGDPQGWSNLGSEAIAINLENWCKNNYSTISCPNASTFQTALQNAFQGNFKQLTQSALTVGVGLLGVPIPLQNPLVQFINSQTSVNLQSLTIQGFDFYLGNKVDIALNNFLGKGLVVSGTGTALFKDIWNNFGKSLEQWDLTNLTNLYGSWQNFAFGFADKHLGLPPGASYQMYNLYQTYQKAYKNYQDTVNFTRNFPDVGQEMNNTTKQYKQQLNHAKAVAIDFAVQLAFGETFAKFDQQLHLPAGTTSGLVSYLITGNPMGLIMAFAGKFLFGTSVELWAGIPICEDSYYQETGLRPPKVQWTKITGNFQRDFPFYQRHAQCSVQRMIKALLEEPDKLGDEKYLPAQIMVGRPEDVDMFADWVYDLYGPTREERHFEGLIANQGFWQWIHVGF